MTTITYNNNNTWTAPLNDFVLVEAWGPGGGGAANNNAVVAGGAGAGAYANGLYQVIAGVVYTIVCPAGGATGNNSNNGSNGAGNTTFTDPAHGLLVSAAFGLAGNRNGTLGAGGTVANSTGTNKIAGNNGTAGASGIGGNGGDAQGGGGAGGQGGNANNNANNGTEPGGGGGGSGNGSRSSKHGGNGAIGAVKITYNANVTVSGQVTLGGVGVNNAAVFVLASSDNNAANTVFCGVAYSNANGNWSQTVPGNQVITACAQYFNGSNLYHAPDVPFVAS